MIECKNCAAVLLKLRTSEVTTSALESISEAMSISSYFEKLLEMKAKALCMVCNWILPSPFVKYSNAYSLIQVLD